MWKKGLLENQKTILGRELTSRHDSGLGGGKVRVFNIHHQLNFKVRRDQGRNRTSGKASGWTREKRSKKQAVTVWGLKDGAENLKSYWSRRKADGGRRCGGGGGDSENERIL